MAAILKSKMAALQNRHVDSPLITETDVIVFLNPTNVGIDTGIMVLSGLIAEIMMILG